VRSVELPFGARSCAQGGLIAQAFGGERRGGGLAGKRAPAWRPPSPVGQSQGQLRQSASKQIHTNETAPLPGQWAAIWRELGKEEWTLWDLELSCGRWARSLARRTGRADGRGGGKVEQNRAGRLNGLRAGPLWRLSHRASRHEAGAVTERQSVANNGRFGSAHCATSAALWPDERTLPGQLGPALNGRPETGRRYIWQRRR